MVEGGSGTGRKKERTVTVGGACPSSNAGLFATATSVEPVLSCRCGVGASMLGSKFTPWSGDMKKKKVR